MKMKKKIYEKPTMEVVKLQQQCMILAGSTEGLNEELQNEIVNEGW